MNSIIMDAHALGSANGLCSCADNGFQATSFIIVGLLTSENEEKETKDYTLANLYLFFLGCAALLFSSLLWYVDYNYYGNVLSTKTKYGLLMENERTKKQSVGSNSDDGHSTILLTDIDTSKT